MATHSPPSLSERPPGGPSEEVTPAAPEPVAVVLRWTLLVLVIAALLTFQPLWAPLLLAAWTALAVRPLHGRLVGKFGPGRAAGVFTVLLVVLTLAPLVVITLSLIGTAVGLAQTLQRTDGVTEAFRTLVAAEPNVGLTEFDARRALEMVQQHGAGAVNAASTIFGAATAVVIGSVVFLFGFYTFLVDGNRACQWLLDHSPLPRRHLSRLGDAFAETGRGLLFGVGLTALFQGFVATVGYVVIGVPQALVLGLLTGFAALIPSIGTGLVWVPLTIALFISDRTGAGVATLVLGVIVSVVDNFVRPALSRYGHLDLPMFVVFVSMLGGIAAFGAWGLLAGPLFVRLAIEALRIWRDEQSPRIELRSF